MVTNERETGTVVNQNTEVVGDYVIECNKTSKWRINDTTLNKTDHKGSNNKTDSNSMTNTEERNASVYMNTNKKIPIKIYYRKQMATNYTV